MVDIGESFYFFPSSDLGTGTSNDSNLCTATNFSTILDFQTLAARELLCMPFTVVEVWVTESVMTFFVLWN